MANPAHGDPEAIRDYARALQQVSSDVTDRLSHLSKWLDDMGRSVWTDSNHAHYQEEFLAVEARMRRELDLFNDQAAHLVTLAARYQELLDR